MTDPIADMLTRIRNAVALNKPALELPYSHAKAAIAKVLQENGYLMSVEMGSELPKTLKLQLAGAEGQSPITEIHRISKPGRRVYVPADKVPTVLRGRGMVVVSTSSGVVSGATARKQGTGGELIAKVW